MNFLLAGLSAQFTGWDWAVVVGYLVLTTWLGAAMAGKQATIRDFFLGGRKLPWYAVSGSIVATEISALTFVSVPWVVFQPGGNFTYLQLGVFGSLLARILVGYILVPAYYQREIYSPYDYMGRRLGGNVRAMTTGLFVLGGLLGQSARIYLTAEVVNVVLHDQLTRLTNHFGLNELAWAIILIAGVSVAWTLIGGITTVIWTDVVLFLAFFVGALIALGAVVSQLDGGVSAMFRAGWEAKESGIPWATWGQPAVSGPWGKFTFFDWSLDPTRAYTIWTAVIASTWAGVGAYGTDQLMAQRMFCCKSPRDARRAIIVSAVGQFVTIAVALVGVGLFAYYQAHEPSPDARELLATRDKGDRILPVFTVEVVPRGLKGLIIAAIFAAAISSVMGILTALSQTVQTAFYEPLLAAFRRARGRSPVTPSDGAADATSVRETAPVGIVGQTAPDRSVLVGRVLVVFWGVALSLMAYLAASVAHHYRSILDLGLSMAGYVGGALLAGFFLGFLRLRIDGRGFMYSGPLSVLCVFALIWHQPWTHVVCWTATVIFLIAWLRPWFGPSRLKIALNDCLQTLGLLAGLGLMLWLNYFGYWEGPLDSTGGPTYITLSWPWQVPIGSTIAFLWGWLLARRNPVDQVVRGIAL